MLSNTLPHTLYHTLPYTMSLPKNPYGHLISASPLPNLAYLTHMSYSLLPTCALALLVYLMPYPCPRTCPTHAHLLLLTLPKLHTHTLLYQPLD